MAEEKLVYRGGLMYMGSNGMVSEADYKKFNTSKKFTTSAKLAHGVSRLTKQTYGTSAWVDVMDSAVLAHLFAQAVGTKLVDAVHFRSALKIMEMKPGLSFEDIDGPILEAIAIVSGKRGTGLKLQSVSKGEMPGLQEGTFRFTKSGVLVSPEPSTKLSRAGIRKELKSGKIVLEIKYRGEMHTAKFQQKNKRFNFANKSRGEKLAIARALMQAGFMEDM